MEGNIEIDLEVWFLMVQIYSCHQDVIVAAQSSDRRFVVPSVPANISTLVP
jgi:hypothetical protein